MKVFLSWSKDMSKDVATQFSKWLPMVIQECSDPFLSTNTDKGDPWFSTIDKALQTAKVGLVFITAENQNEPWLNFESGALITRLGDRRLCPVLVGLSKTDYAGPMKNLQLTDITDKEDVMLLLETINAECDRRLSRDVLAATFDREWEALDAAVTKAREGDLGNAATPPRRLDEKVDEMLEIVRTLSSRARPELTSSSPSSAYGDRVTHFITAMEEAEKERIASWVAAIRSLPGEENRGARLDWLRRTFGGDYATAKADDTKQGAVTDVRVSKQGTPVVSITKPDSDQLIWLGLKSVDFSPF